MNGEMLLDAMNYLDDDLVEETARIRERKRKPYWLATVAAAAACLCLFLFTGRGDSIAPEAADMDGNYFNGLTDDLKMESSVETPMESVAVAIAVLRITEVEDSCFSGVVQNTDDDAQILTICCDGEIAQGLQPGDLVKVSYETGRKNWLIELEFFTE